MRRIVLGVIAGGLALVAAGSLASYLYERPTIVRVAVARDSDEFRLMTVAAQTISRAREPVRLRIMPVDSAAASAAQLEANQAEFAVVRTDIDMPKSGQTAVILNRSAAMIIAPMGADYAGVADLKGHTIGVIVPRPEAVANPRLLDMMLAHYDAKATTREIPLLIQDLPDALATHRIDAVFVVGPPTAGPIADVISMVASAGGGAPVIVPVDSKALAQASPALESFEVPRGAFGGATALPTADLQSLGVSTRLVARSTVPDAVVGEVVRILFARRPTIAASVPIANRMEAPATDKGLALPIHPGAAAYLDDDEETFLDKYSDFIYIGAMILSVLASAVAALASRLTAANTARAEELLENLFVHLANARNAWSPEELDELERDTDRILVEALQQGSLQVLDQHRVTALGLAIDQVRLAIGDRRRYVENSPRLANFPPPRAIAGE